MISSDSKTKTLNINIYEHPEYNLGVLDNKTSTVDYDILIWNGKGEILAKKIGKVSRKNLSKSLSFPVPDLQKEKLSFSVGLNVTIEGKKTSFITISQDNTLLANFIGNKVSNGEDPYFFTSFSFGEISDLYTIDVITIEENVFEEVYIKTIGSDIVILEDELYDVEGGILEAERAIRRLSSIKKQSLGGTVILDQEVKLLDLLGKGEILKTLDLLVKMYETTGTLGVSEYRQRLYTNLKPVLDNLIIAKGRLEKITGGLKTREGGIPVTKG